MKKSIVFFLSAATLFAVTSCGGDSEKTDETDIVDSTKVEDMQVSPISETFFQVPSPGEMLTFIKMIGNNSKDTKMLNPASNAKNYTDAKSKALNFGIYSCDLSYCSIFEIGADALKYFPVVKTLGDQIGVSTAIKPEILKRLQDNLGKPDSLALITDDIYFSSFETLEGSKQGPTLACVVAGGWIESIYIATQLAQYKANSPIIERLADQKYTLENIIEFFKKHEADQNVASIKADFESLLAEFNKIAEKDVEAAKQGDGKTKVLAGGKQLNITEENYNIIKEKIKSIRNGYAQIK
ncbi:MAG: hypothetical protein LCH32_07510 [Bacteroidetes bacterium]|nr:hypothetical protein [Bacteroidota bacterium]